MVLCLGLITLVCGALLGVVYVETREAVDNAAKEKSMKAVADVSPAFESLSDSLEVDGTPYYVGRDSQGQPVSLVVSATTSKGFGGKLELMVGFRPDGTIHSTSVLQHSETPGLGAKCTEDGFKAQFDGFNPSVKVLAVRGDEGDVDAITAATITSKAYCDALQAAVQKFNYLSQTVFPKPQQEEEAAVAEENIEEETGNE